MREQKAPWVQIPALPISSSVTLKFTHLKDRVINHLYSSQDYLGVYTGIFFKCFINHSQMLAIFTLILLLGF